MNTPAPDEPEIPAPLDSEPPEAPQGQLLLFDEGKAPSTPRESKDARSPRRRQAPAPGWPDPQRFPFNDPISGQTVGSIVMRELKRAKAPLIITGYTSLPMVVHLFAGYHGARPAPQVRLLLGHEPNMTRSGAIYRPQSAQALGKEIEAYWLERGISVYQSAAILNAISFLETDTVAVRISASPSHPVHAKIYRADYAITIGSSNLSENGMRVQLEANRRHEVWGERAAFDEATSLAEQIWTLGRDYKSELLTLLRAMLRVVSWEEALARACAEILDGRWARRYTLADPLDDGPALWPAQRQGLAQAMWLIDQVGSVLVADATGSGKTRMGSEILRAMVNHLWARGRVRNHIPVIVAPPRVLDNWKRDARAINLPVETTSHALLSGSSEEHRAHQGVLQRAQVVAIDEAHNFLNRDSNRSRALLRATPEHALLLTATPINREAGDLLTIINLLGPDNFDDQIIDLVVELAQTRVPRGERTLVSDEQYGRLQRAIRQFTLRRTKRDFNALIRQQPEAYRNRLGQPCRYPNTEAKFYPTGESAEDATLMGPVYRTLDRLQGVAFFHRTLRLPDSPAWRGRPNPEAAWIESMLRGAKALARYHVLAALRSSRAAALEHLVGTREAWRLLGYGEEPPLKLYADTGNMRDRVLELGGQLPQNELGAVDLPIFLRDADVHRQLCERESQIYAGLVQLIGAISDRREATKAELIAGLLPRRPLVLAFDARPITLHDIARRLTDRSVTVRIATPERKTDSARVLEEFALGSPASGVVALCTDAMAEGINLQAASAIVHLDLPTVVRRLEQRDGRLSRMDSGHAVVESWLPQDGPAFAPREGEALIFQRYRIVQTLIGGNVTLPGETDTGLDEGPDAEEPLEEGAADGRILTPDALVERRRLAEEVAERIPDAFSPVRDLVIGADAIVPGGVYLHYRGVQARVVSAVAAVQAVEPWAFLCLAGADDGAPRFVLLDGPAGEPHPGSWGPPASSR